MKRPQADRETNQKVVRLRLDAGFFYDRAVRSLERRQYEKAVKYFRLAVEKEPDNAVNHCNLAGVLSELGRYEESNEVLERVLDEVDPELYECLFYMANNSANMGDFELAEDYLLEYLSLDPDGEFAAEAEEMLGMIAGELGRAPREPMPLQVPAHVQAHEEARRHLEEGRFLLAIDLLEKILRDKPDFLPARNNLALAFYYTGSLDLSLKYISEVLEEDPANLHALCNLAVLSHHVGKAETGDKLVRMLRKLVPVQPDQICKLATTMGILGEHETAFQLFARLARLQGFPEPGLCHYAAVAAWNTGRTDRARRWWKWLLEMEDSDVARFYLERSEEWIRRGETPVLPYHYQLPFEEQLLEMNPDGPDIQSLDRIRANPLLRSSFIWALKHGDKETKRHVLQLLSWIADEEVVQLLRRVIEDPAEDPELKEEARAILIRIGEETPEKRGDEPDEPFEERSPITPNRRWEQVITCLMEHMSDRSEEMKVAGQVLWTAWVIRGPSELSSVRKPEIWAAAVHYLVAKYHDEPLTQKEVAEHYGVSVSSVARAVKLLASVAERCFT
ncbi:tetratricopeptide repeat protein [Staphylospora marina]|uniref:tetratricopeptide repeat protein n=1 Tax=Staphylospora marina TaxID=2490858 RepID=UPI000F5BD04F|nr:tetratricopeptide repeat protein [Staphylospora marina]